jgi:hypothetical protein
MISRAIFLSAIIGWSGAGLLPPEPPTAAQLMAKARQKSRSAVCDKKKKSKKVRELCDKWGEPT